MTRADKGVYKINTKIDGEKVHTKEYQLWKGIVERCFSERYQNKYPTYAGCKMSENFLSFQYFAEWCQSQVGYLQKDYHLDKDILIDGNKLYSEDTCVFAPKDLNAFSKKFDRPREDLPTGVYKTKSGKFKAKAGDKVFGNFVVGIFATIEEASEAYIEQKKMYSKIWYNRLLSGEFIVDNRVVERMKDWNPK